jgi:hypothetical protein
MRTLRTEMRLRRLIRQHAVLIERLASERGDPEAAAAAERRLRGLLADVRAAWSADLGAAAARDMHGELPLLDGHVSRSLKTLEAAIVVLGSRPGLQLEWLAERFRATAVPLLLFLRGLEETPAELLGAWAAPSLAQSA